MRVDWNHLEKYRDLATSSRGDPFGWFIIRRLKGVLRIMASGGDNAIPWEHVSVSLADRCPAWDEMCYVKSLFWGDDETVMQLHVPAADHKNCHPYCLHLWKPLGADIPRPPSLAVAP